ncbi:rhomboid family intramembrane serine protease [Clostridium sp. D2Q-11]|uniref:Rhomboid family intramembrane serine protease n=1 Tax=Anaeromonas frigoriresistens TaxID=2683708 RepID=A0A942UV60_9FIRM|nr:rhomboid family intramembrane serine protease [Anaeromonas frigoriresistens]MBS4539173.1 rhomboid family intramembrane serine protease [Anaeromonas frigoriresistens]
MDRLGRIHYNAPVTLTFTFSALGVLLLKEVYGDIFVRYLFTNFRTSLSDPMQYVRLFSYILGHANWQHFSSNFLIILLLGPMIEEKYGSNELIKMILITALITGVINTLLFDTGLIGASGIVFMMILLSSFANVRAGHIPLTLIIVGAIFIGKELVDAVTVKDSISQMAHIVGGISGAVLGNATINKGRKNVKNHKV